MTARNAQPQTIAALARAYRAGDAVPSAIIAEMQAAIAAREPDVHAYVDIFDTTHVAAEADRALETHADEQPLLGIPIAVKSNMLVQGERATASSNILASYVAPYDATVVARLRAAGAVFMGSTNMDEFAMGSSTENSAFGVTRNPHDLTRVPGGSSGGSAAAVAMGGVCAALGTDTGGSVRLPASFCGLVGLKPTYGAVSRSGLIAMGSSLDQAGPLTHTVGDTKLLFDIMHGPDAYDATTYPAGTYPEVSRKDRYRIGVPRHLLASGVDVDVLALFEQTLEELARDGHEIVDIELPYAEKGLAAYYIVMPAEVSSNLARYDGMRYGLHVDGENLLSDYLRTRKEGFGAEVRRRILLGTYVLSAGYYDAYYGTAERVRDLMRAELADVYSHVDVIATPTAATPAFKIGEKSDPLAMYLTDVFTVPANLTGAPALSVPAGVAQRDGQALPVGIQFIGPHAGEDRLFDIGSRVCGE